MRSLRLVTAPEKQPWGCRELQGTGCWALMFPTDKCSQLSTGMGTMVGLERETQLSPEHLSKVNQKNSAPQPCSTIRPAPADKGTWTLRSGRKQRWVSISRAQELRGTAVSGHRRYEGHHRSRDLLLKRPKLLYDPLNLGRIQLGRLLQRLWGDENVFKEP